MLINARYTEIHQKFNFENIQDLICILIDLIPNYGAIHHRIISVIIYLMLRLLLFRFEECRDILSTLELSYYRIFPIFFEKKLFQIFFLVSFVEHISDF